MQEMDNFLSPDLYLSIARLGSLSVCFFFSMEPCKYAATYGYDDNVIIRNV